MLSREALQRPRLPRLVLVALAILVLAPRPIGDQPMRNRRGLRAQKAHKLALARRKPRIVPTNLASGPPAPAASWTPPAVPVAASAPSSASALPSASAAPPPSGSASAVPLDLAAYDDPIVLVPPTADGSKAPVVVAVHGIQSMPESVCDPLRETVATRAFVLCPAGVAVGFENGEKLYQFADAPRLWDEIEAGLEALRAAYPDDVDTDKPMYVGFSQGSILGVDVVTREAALPYAVFVEGGNDAWNKDRIATLAKRGTKRVLLVTGSEYWVTRARTAVPLFGDTGVAVHHVHLDGLGHHFDGQVAKTIDGEIDWLADGDPRW